MKKLVLLFASLLAFGANAEGEVTKEVFISPGVVSININHQGESVQLQRNQDRDNEISDFYLKTTRGKIQAMHPFAPHLVETIGELEMIDYVKQHSAGDESILVIDTRTPNWLVFTGAIPTAINIPYTRFKNKEKALEIMEDQLGVQVDDVFDFSYAKTLVMYCNGVWCGQTPAAVKALLKYGYPAAKIKYYRGGMNAWKSLGLTTVNL
ncbi:MAG: rhodanese-like domain-containing protein [Candidatus Thioglobus sp.]|uniref:rhodanese-like domain-containing protein n=1 Tax=Candidatus Thioglobus sp. TaxID=2026721 RepID=UPI002607936D|nr:rhodanese-like domain-containing protein [Candidatus Thioglobus sp.]MDC9727095.1 rhodanese-like domain-containing protein [Candidatus Thioglobus sp.]